MKRYFLFSVTSLILLANLVCLLLLCSKNEEKFERETVKKEISFVVYEESSLYAANKEEMTASNGFEYIEEIPLDENLQRYVWDLCTVNEVSPFLVYGVIQQESGFRTNALSSDGKDYGLMQIREINHDWLNKSFGYELDYSDPYDNIMAGIKMIKGHLENRNGDITEALMCYNMGATGASNAWNKGIYSTEYSRNVVEYMNNWESIYKGL